MFSRLDYCNSVFPGLSKKSVRQLLLIQNASVWVLTRTKRVDQITPVLCPLHWLPVSQIFKILLLVCEALNGSGQKYISDSDLWGHQVQVCFQSLESKLNTEKWRSAIMHHISGTNSQKTTSLLQRSPHLNEGWRPFYLRWTFTEVISRL